MSKPIYKSHYAVVIQKRLQKLSHCTILRFTSILEGFYKNGRQSLVHYSLKKESFFCRISLLFPMAWLSICSCTILIGAYCAFSTANSYIDSGFRNFLQVHAISYAQSRKCHQRFGFCRWAWIWASLPSTISLLLPLSRQPLHTNSITQSYYHS